MIPGTRWQQDTPALIQGAQHMASCVALRVGTYRTMLSSLQASHVPPLFYFWYD